MQGSTSLRMSRHLTSNSHYSGGIVKYEQRCLRKSPPALPLYGDSCGPNMVACQVHMSSPAKPAEQLAGGSYPNSWGSFARVCEYAMCVKANMRPFAFTCSCGGIPVTMFFCTCRHQLTNLCSVGCQQPPSHRMSHLFWHCKTETTIVVIVDPAQDSGVSVGQCQMHLSPWTHIFR